MCYHVSQDADPLQIKTRYSAKFEEPEALKVLHHTTYDTWEECLAHVPVFSKESEPTIIVED